MSGQPDAPAPLVAIVMGSESDWPSMRKCAEQLDALEIRHEIRVLSAHRTPELVREYAMSVQGRGVKVVIAAAGLAAHLAGALAASTSLPVIGVPMAAGALNGFDALLSTVQMPPGGPVATVGIGEVGAKNSAVLAAEILAISNPTIAGSLNRFRATLTEQVRSADTKLRR